MHSSDHNNFQSQIDELTKQNTTLQVERNEAIDSIKTLHKQQCELYQSFKLLRSKYDDLKTEIQHILWDFIPSQHNDIPLNDFSELGNVNLSVFESPNRIGNYDIGSLLGEGQFANVKLCTNSVTKKEYAVKVINKKKVSTLTGLKRIKNEIKLLKLVDHPNIVKFIELIHSTKTIYIITEVGGKDLFEFFEANPQGVSGETARQIILGIVKPLIYLHKSGICHRDLKPENILLSETKEDLALHKCVQLCDFGHSVISSTKCNTLELTGLCGSPGFFAPEMILGGGEKYDGFAADVWSVGCIMLELTRGHHEFCRIWMTSYDYEILQSEFQFETSLTRSVTEVHKHDNNEIDELTSFLSKILIIDPSNRLKAPEMLDHPWLEKDKYLDYSTSYNEQLYQDDSLSTSSESSDDFSDETMIERTKRRNMFRNSLSSRARKHFATSINVKIDETIDQIHIRLPPAEPDTPSFKAAKRTLIEAKKIKNKHVMNL